MVPTMGRDAVVVPAHRSPRSLFASSAAVAVPSPSGLFDCFYHQSSSVATSSLTLVAPPPMDESAVSVVTSGVAAAAPLSKYRSICVVGDAPVVQVAAQPRRAYTNAAARPKVRLNGKALRRMAFRGRKGLQTSKRCRVRVDAAEEAICSANAIGDSSVQPKRRRVPSARELELITCLRQASATAAATATATAITTTSQ